MADHHSPPSVDEVTTEALNWIVVTVEPEPDLRVRPARSQAVLEQRPLKRPSEDRPAEPD
jgi:hypothetical protein